jgi:hypothetical protein
MKRLVHVEVAQLADHTGKMPVIHSSRCGIGALGTDQLGFFEPHDKLTRDVPHEQVLDRFLVRLSHWQPHSQISHTWILHQKTFV